MKHMLNWLELSIRSETGTMFEWNLQLCSWSQYSTRPSMTWPLSETPSSARSSASPLALLTWWNDCLKALLLMYFHYIHQHLRVLSCIVFRVFPLRPPTSKGLQPSSYRFPCLGLFVSNKHCPSIHFIYSDLTAWMLMKYWSPELSFPHTLDLVKPIRFKWYFYKCGFLLGFRLHGWSCTSSVQPSSYWSPLPSPVCFQKALQFSLLYLLWFHCMDVYEVPNQASYTRWTWVNW